MTAPSPGIDPHANKVVVTVRISAGSVTGGDIAAGNSSVWVRTTEELAVHIDAISDRVMRVLGSRDVLPQTSSRTEVVGVSDPVSYTAVLPVRESTVSFVSGCSCPACR